MIFPRAGRSARTLQGQRSDRRLSVAHLHLSWPCWSRARSRRLLPPWPGQSCLCTDPGATVGFCQDRCWRSVRIF